MEMGSWQGLAILFEANYFQSLRIETYLIRFCRVGEIGSCFVLLRFVSEKHFVSHHGVIHSVNSVLGNYSWLVLSHFRRSLSHADLTYPVLGHHEILQDSTLKRPKNPLLRGRKKPTPTNSPAWERMCSNTVILSSPSSLA